MKRIKYVSPTKSLSDIPGFDHVKSKVVQSCEHIGVDIDGFLKAHKRLADQVIKTSPNPRHITQVIDPVGMNRNQYFLAESLIFRRAAFYVPHDGLYLQREDVGRVLAANLGLDMGNFRARPDIYEPFEVLMQAMAVGLMGEAAEKGFPIMLAMGGQSEMINDALRRLQWEEYTVEVVLHHLQPELTDNRLKSLANVRFYEFDDEAAVRAKVDAQLAAMSNVFDYHLKNANTLRIVYVGDSADDYRGDIAFYDGKWHVHDADAFGEFLEAHNISASDTAVAFPDLCR